MIVDDEPFNRLALCYQLLEEGQDSDECGSGLQAVQIVKQIIEAHKPLYPVILLDFSMPELDGPSTAI